MAKRALYRRVAADLQSRINTGTWRPGQQLPSRTSLAAEFGVHEQTVRLAVALLRQQGVLEGEARRRLYVAYPPAVRALTDPDATWPYGCETIAAETCLANDELAGRLDVRVGATLHREALECWDPNGRSAMLVTTWWRGRRRKHQSAIFEVDATRLTEEHAHSLRLPVDTVAYRVTRIRLDAEGRPVETADLILPLDRWVLRFQAHPQGPSTS